LKAEGTAEIEKLMNDLITSVPGGTGYTFIIG